jgi:catechol 2,3-dioxygenase-like lactoylglutathione lyase family enzyme
MRVPWAKEGRAMITGVHHFSFSVTHLDRTIDFYTNILGVKLQSRGHNKYDTLGSALFGTKWGVNQPQADLELAVMNIGGTRVEFIEYKDPAARAYHKNPSIAGSAHLALKVENIEETRRKMEAAGVEFHSPINSYLESGKIEWKWCYFRDPDGIVLELVQQSQAWE